MPVLRAKQPIIDALRRRVGGIEAATRKPSGARPAAGAWVCPTFFASGLHEMVGDTLVVHRLENRSP
jgi:hypothetical protein